MIAVGTAVEFAEACFWILLGVFSITAAIAIVFVVTFIIVVVMKKKR